MKYIALLQDNWVTIVIVITAIIVLLKAIAHLRVRWAKISPDTADDVEAKQFSQKIDAIIGFLKDIFLPIKKKKNDGGFVDLHLLMPAIAMIVGVMCGAFLNKRFREPDVVKVPIPEYIEVQKIVKVEAESKKGTINTVKEYNCENGNLSSEKTLEEYFAEKNAREESEVAKHQLASPPEPKLDLLFGGGVHISEVEKWSDLSLDKLKPQLAIGAAYDEYGGFVASDFKSDHSAYAFRRKSF